LRGLYKARVWGRVGRFGEMGRRLHADQVEKAQKNKKGRKEVPFVGGVKKATKKRLKPGTLALREIRKFQREKHGNLCRKAPFQRFVRERGELQWAKFVGEGKKRPLFEKGALSAVQDIVEAYITVMLEDGCLQALHAKRVTVGKEDWAMVKRMRHETDYGAVRVKKGAGFHARRV